jgi:hypothetical protein
MGEIFGANNFVSIITYVTPSSQTRSLLLLQEAKEQAVILSKDIVKTPAKLMETDFTFDREVQPVKTCILGADTLLRGAAETRQEFYPALPANETCLSNLASK